MSEGWPFRIVLLEELRLQAEGLYIGLCIHFAGSS